MKLMFLIPLIVGTIVACSKSDANKDPKPPVPNDYSSNTDGSSDGDASPVGSDGKTNICNYSFEEDKSIDHFSALNRTWRSSNDILKSEKEIDGEMVEVLSGFRLSNTEYRSLSFLFEKYAKEHHDIKNNENSSFKFERIAISKPLENGDFKGFRLIAMSGISEYSFAMECIMTSYKLDKYDDQEELSMAGWTVSSSIGDAENNSKESFFEGKYKRGYIQK